MVPDNPCESYAMLVRESMQFDIPTPSRRIEIIRELPQPAVFNAVHIITGIRRCGKTFYLFQKIHDLLQNGVSRNDIFYFNFADDRLQPMQDTVLNDIVTEYWRQYPDSRDHGCYLFLDEVQECANWQGFCQHIAEHEAVTLVITGSSSKLSSEEIATNFRGRSHPHAMAPLSFREFCDFRGIETPTAGSTLADAVFSPREVTRFEAAYNDYLTIGGFPAVQRMVEADRIETLQGYVRDVVARDVAERLGRENITLATQIALFLLRNTAMLKPGSTAVPKMYAVDQGMVYAVSRANQQDIGKRLETAIFCELQRRTSGRRTETITSYTMPTSKQEKVDFLIGDALTTEPYGLIQVCANMGNEKTRAREIGSLQAVMQRTNVDSGLILTLNEGETIELPDSTGTIHVLPSWKWSLYEA